MEPIRKSTIFVALGRTREVYHSVDEMPQALRRKLASNGMAWSSATILIADRQGREEISRALRGEPGSLPLKFLESVSDEKASGRPSPSWWGGRVRLLAALFLWSAAAVIAWLAFHSR